LSRIVSLVLTGTLGLLLAAPALAAGAGSVRVHSHGFTSYTHAGSTYHITPSGHGFMVSRQTSHGWSSVHVSYQNPSGHHLLYVRNGCIVYIDYDNGAWTGYYYYVC